MTEPEQNNHNHVIHHLLHLTIPQQPDHNVHGETVHIHHEHSSPEDTGSDDGEVLIHVGIHCLSHGELSLEVVECT